MDVLQGSYVSVYIKCIYLIVKWWPTAVNCLEAKWGVRWKLVFNKGSHLVSWPLVEPQSHQLIKAYS